MIVAEGYPQCRPAVAIPTTVWRAGYGRIDTYMLPVAWQNSCEWQLLCAARG